MLVIVYLVTSYLEDHAVSDTEVVVGGKGKAREVVGTICFDQMWDDLSKPTVGILC